MKPIAYGDRGRSVEDIQRRLLQMGYTLSLGVDGVFGHDTAQSVRQFQEDYRLPVTGAVDIETWSALVDSSFSFGDRMLYLRSPYFHGRDVATLQRALNSLGFSCGANDGIFGPYTERAVREFQLNMDTDSDGVAGARTFSALNGMKHMWDTKDPRMHSAAHASSLQREQVLSSAVWSFTSSDADTRQIARRVENLAIASCPEVVLSAGSCPPRSESMPTVCLNFVPPTQSANSADTVLFVSDRAALSHALSEAVAHQEKQRIHINVTIPEALLAHSDKIQFQYMAAIMLDSVCMVFASSDLSV